MKKQQFCKQCKQDLDDHIWACIFWDGFKKEYDFELVCSHNLVSALLHSLNRSYIRCTNVSPNTTKFYTQFDNAEDGMPDEQWPFAGMLNVFVDEQDDEKPDGGDILVWVKVKGRWQGYDPDDYEEVNGDISLLTERKHCR